MDGIEEKKLSFFYFMLPFSGPLVVMAFGKLSGRSLSKRDRPHNRIVAHFYLARGWHAVGK